jgi:NitT/TauT family transport system substrate-binding protein
MKKLILLALLLLSALPALAKDPLRLGVLPIEDSVPLFIAQQERFFTEEKLKVELVPFQSALERDSALAAGAIDGAITDPIGAILFDQGRGRLKITSLCLGEQPQEGVFAILAAPGSALAKLEELKGVEIAVSTATIIEYVTDRLLLQHGFTEGEIKKIEVVKMPIRMQMLLSGAVKAATLPEPLASIAVGQGAKVLIDDGSGNESLSQTVLVFRDPVLVERKADISAFFRAYARAVKAINSDPEKFRALVVDKGRIPPNLAKSYTIPHFPQPQPFPQTLYTPIIEWLAGKGLTKALPYHSMVVGEVLP